MGDISRQQQQQRFSFFQGTCSQQVFTLPSEYLNFKVLVHLISISKLPLGQRERDEQGWVEKNIERKRQKVVNKSQP